MALRGALLAHGPLTQLLGGAHVYEELPRGQPASFVEFTGLETRDWSTADKTAYEHFLTLAVRTNSRSRKLAQDVTDAVATALESAAPPVPGHRLVNLRLVFWTITRGRGGEGHGALLRIRAATEPL